MPTYALLGATGATGSSVLRHLLQSQHDSLRINICVRSRSKLLSAFPDLETTKRPRVRIVQGTSTDAATLAECLGDATIIFMCVAQNGSPIGTTLCQDTVAAIIHALRRRRQAEGKQYQPRTVIQLRSASLNPALAAQVPVLVHKMVSFCLFASYADMEQACIYYSEARREGVLDHVLVDPPTLHDAHGKQPTGYRLITTEPQATALSYADLGAALCEIASRARDFHGLAVGVTATGHVNQSWGVLARYLLEGGMSHLEYRFGMENIIVVFIFLAIVSACLVLYM